MSARVHVPGSHVPMEQLPHGLLIYVEEDGGETGYEVTHPVDCPVACPWWPGAPFDDEPVGIAVAHEHRLCYVEWEIENVGLDSLDVSEVVTTFGTHIDAWKHLPPGRYLIEGWYHPGGWAGSEPVDPDGGLVLLGPS